MTFTGTIRDLNHARICRRLRLMHQPWLMRRGVLMAAVGYLVLLLALVTVANVTDARLPEWSSYLPLVVFLAVLVTLLVWRRRHVWETVRNAPLRQTDQQFDLTDAGLRVTSDLSESLIRWPAVLDVIVDPEGLLFLTGQMEYFVIPTAAFLETDIQTARDQCLRWIEAARTDG